VFSTIIGMKHEFKILYFLYRSKVNNKGKVPIYCRVTHKNKQQHFSTGFFILPKDWDSKTFTVINSPLSIPINQYLTAIKAKGIEISLSCKMNEDSISLKQYTDRLRGIEEQQQVNGFLEVFQKHNDEVESLVGKSYAPATLQKFEGIYNQIQQFIKKQYKQDDVLLENLKLKFILDLEYYLLSEKNMKQISINKTLQRVKKIVRYAIAHELMEKDPFLLHKAKQVHLDVVFLDNDELSRLEQYPFEKDIHILVRDLFVFCCYTGLAYRELSELSSANIVTGFDDKDWIKITRQKTGKPLMIPLLDRAKSILDKYAGHEPDKLLPTITNQRLNKVLKEISEILGIKKKLSSHTARKTFASTVLLYNNVPMEVVSELLGHSSLKITQKHYGKVVNKKLSQQMDVLGKKLDKD